MLKKQTPAEISRRGLNQWFSSDLLYHASNFGSEVVSSLLNALALFKANKGSDLDAAAEILGNLSYILSYVHVAILHESLIYQAVLLVELLYTAGNHLLDYLSRLVLQLLIVLDLSLENLLQPCQRCLPIHRT